MGNNQKSITLTNHEEKSLKESIQNIQSASAAVPLLTELLDYIRAYCEAQEQDEDCGPTKLWNDKLFHHGNGQRIKDLINSLAALTDYESDRVAKLLKVSLI
jgi:hypothetical protein